MLQFTLPERIEKFDEHLFKDFDCGCSVLNGYLRDTVRMQHEVSSGNLNLYVIYQKDANNDVVGFFALRNASLHNTEFTTGQKKRALHKLTNIGAIELVYLGVDQRFQGRKLGSMLLAKAEEMYAEYSCTGVLLYLVSSPTADSFYASRGYTPMKPAQPNKDNFCCKRYFKPYTLIAQDIAAASSSVTLSDSSVIAETTLN